MIKTDISTKVLDCLEEIDITNYIKPEKIFKQNQDDIVKFFNLLNHKKKTLFQVFLAITEKEITSKASLPTKEYYVSDQNELISLCKKYKQQGILCCSVNEREVGQTKISDGINRLNLLPFDIDIKSNLKIEGVSSIELIKEEFEVVKKCIIELQNLGFNVDYINFSGNGFHIGIKVDLDVPTCKSLNEWYKTSEYKKLVYLENLLKKFETKNVEIDSITKDICRRIKIAGTYNVKRYKIGKDQFKLIPKEKWRLSRILYLNNNIDEEKNNIVFKSLKIEEPKNPNLQIQNKESITNFLFLKNLIESGNINDKKLLMLYNGKLSNEYKSRSEEEFSLICKLIFYGFNESQIKKIMNDSQIGKWQSTSEQYKNITINKAFLIVSDRFKWELFFKNLEKKKRIKKLKTSIDKKIDELTPEIDDDKIYEILKLLPQTSNDFYRDKCIIKIHKKTGILKSTLKENYKNIVKPNINIYSGKNEESEDDIDKRETFEEITSQDNAFALDNLKNDFYLFENDGIYLIKWIPKTDNYNLTKIVNGNIEFLYKAFDIDHYIYSFKINNDLHEHKTIDEVESIIRHYFIHRDAIYGLRTIITSMEIKKKPIKYILGFSSDTDNEGWILPQTNIDKETGETNFTIICHTQMQTETYKRVEKMIKKYTIEEKEKLKEKLKRFIEITDISEDELNIIIGWTIASPFISAFKRKYDIFPLLILRGKQITGKSSILEFFINIFYKVYKTIYTPSVFHSASRREDIISMSTFPIFIDEIEGLDDYTINMLKSHTTNEAEFVRKKKNQGVMKRPYQSAIAMSCNHYPDGFNDSALNTKLIVLSIDGNEIDENSEWKKLRREFKREKLFSFIFDITKDWNYISWENEIEEMIEKYHLDEERKQNKKIDSRLWNCYIIINFGIWLLNKAFDIELDREDVLDVLKEERTTLMKPLWIEFKEFCKERLNSGSEKYRLIVTDTDEYIFQQKDKQEFNKRLRDNGIKPINTLPKLLELIKDGLNKRYHKKIKINWKTIDNKTYYGIIIDKTILDE